MRSAGIIVLAWVAVGCPERKFVIKGVISSLDGPIGDVRVTSWTGCDRNNGHRVRIASSMTRQERCVSIELYGCWRHGSVGRNGKAGLSKQLFQDRSCERGSV